MRGVREGEYLVLAPFGASIQVSGIAYIHIAAPPRSPQFHLSKMKLWPH